MNIAPDVMATLELLSLWDLTQLNTVFAEQEVSTRALQYLTEDEICQLIPKIGPRTVFRGLLKEWRKKQHSKQRTSKNMQIEHEAEQLSYSTQLHERNDGAENFDLNKVKIEPNIELEETEGPWVQNQTDIYENEELTDVTQTSVTLAQQNKNSLLHKPNLSPSLEVQPIQNQTELTMQDTIMNSPSDEEPFDVYNFLSSTFEGRVVLDYYRNNNCLDRKYRKILTGLLVSVVVDKRLPKYTRAFMDFTQQIIKIFPTERPDTYFVPHQSNAAARGALYYRYSNYTRKLRKEGLLEYKHSSMKKFNFQNR